MLIVDMRSPGVELRPMTQITGHAEFCELFLDDVVVPKANLLAERGDGWKIAMHTLGHERGTAALPRQVKLRTWLDRAVRVAAERAVDGEPLLDDPEAQVALARALIGDRGPAPPRLPDRRRVPQRRRRRPRQLERQAADGRGRAAARGDRARGARADAAARRPGDAAEDDFWNETYLYSRAATIYGGTQQIQRNIIADRVLGLPQE